MSHLFFTDVVILTASFLTILKWQTVYPSKYVFKGTSNYTFQKTQQTNLFILLKIKYPLTNHRHPTKPTNLQAPPPILTVSLKFLDALEFSLWNTSMVGLLWVFFRACSSDTHSRPSHPNLLSS